MRRQFPTLATVTAAAAAALATAAKAAEPAVIIQHAAARVVVIPEARSNIAVTVHPGDPRLPPLVVSQHGQDMVVDGGVEEGSGPFGRGPRVECVGGYTVSHLFGTIAHTRDSRGVRVAGRGVVDYDQLPVVTARVPLDANVQAGVAVWGQIGASRSTSFDGHGCGDWTIAPVQGALNLALAGSGDVRAATSGRLNADVAGSGDVVTADIAGPTALAVAGSGTVKTGAIAAGLRAAVSGSGDVVVASVDGPVQAQVHASGGVVVNGGRAATVQANVAGSGDFIFRGQAGALNAAVAGSGDVVVAHVSGPVTKSVAGSGEVHAGG